MVNNFAAEMSPWITLFQEMKASYGKYAITGNHDYGDYTRWPTETDKRNNLNQFFENMKSMGFHMLNNDRIPIVEGRDTLWLVGGRELGQSPFSPLREIGCRYRFSPRASLHHPFIP